MVIRRMDFIEEKLLPMRLPMRPKSKVQAQQRPKQRYCH
jgi:hypothetical protein